MHKLFRLVFVLYSMIAFAQIDDVNLKERMSQVANDEIQQEKLNPYYSKKEYIERAIDEMNSFKNFANPDENSELSLYFKQNLDVEDLKKVDFDRITSSYLFKKYPYKESVYDYTIRLTFKVLANGKLDNVSIDTGDLELNRKIKKLFVLFPLEKLNLTDESRNCLNTVQIFAKKGRKVIIEASTNVVYDEQPSFNDGSRNFEKDFISNLKNTTPNFWNKLQTYLLNNLSLEKISNSKLKGEIRINPRFSINEKGEIYRVNSIASNKILKEEIDRVILAYPQNLLPARRNNIPKDYFFETTYALMIEKKK